MTVLVRVGMAVNTAKLVTTQTEVNMLMKSIAEEVWAKHQIHNLNVVCTENLSDITSIY